MSESQPEGQVSAGAPPGARLMARQLAVWLPLCLIHGTAVAWLAFGVQKYFAPLGIFPFLVGLTLGVTLCGLMRLVQVANRGTVVLGAFVAATIAIFGQHYFSYQEQHETAERQAAQFRMAAQAHPDLVRGTPPKPASGVLEYLRWQSLRGRPIAGEIVARGAWAWASWAFDGVLILLTALAVIMPALRQPYCNQCRTWYSTVRRGELSAAAASQLASTMEIEAPEEVCKASFRCVHCQGGCGVVGFEICWELSGGRRTSSRVWIPPADRSRLEERLAPCPER